MKPTTPRAAPDSTPVYDDRGAGPAVLFVQGVGVHGDGWRPQVDALAERYRCLTFDHRGIGRTPRSGEVTVESMAADARAVLDAAGCESAHVVGHSLGGLVALRLALDAPARVRSLALLCTFASGRAAAPPTPRMIWYGMRSRVGTRRMRRHGFLWLVLAPAAAESEDLDALAARLAPLFGHDLGDTPPIVSDQLRALRRCDITSRLGELSAIPSLVVAARHDPIAPPQAGRALAAGLARSRYVEAADASHGLPISHAAWTNRLLEDHLAASAGPTVRT